MRFPLAFFALLFCLNGTAGQTAFGADERDTGVGREYSVRQLTFGPSHHLFGYIGHAGTVPWSGNGRYILALRSSFQDHMPERHEPADVLLLDTQANDTGVKVDETRGWNLQQGTMFFWNPAAPNTQFFFNDRDPDDGTLFTVLFDLSKGEHGERVREYRFPDSPVANSGMARHGRSFLALNYGRLARLRLVTGYAGLTDWSASENAPANDGIFRIDVASGERTLLVSYARMKEIVRDVHPEIDEYGLFINHTLWNRTDELIYFYTRANFRSRLPKVDIPMTISADGTDLRRHPYLGGHPEWDAGRVIIGSSDRSQVRYDTVSGRIIGTMGDEGTFVNPGGDIAFAPDGQWFANGHRADGEIHFTFLNTQTGRVIRAGGFPFGKWKSGATRIDPAPGWNRDSNAILFGAYDGSSDTRQLFLLQLHP